MDGTETFNLHATLTAVGQAATAVICHMFLLAGVHGLVVAIGLLIAGTIMAGRGHKLGKPFIAVSKKVFITCGILIAPGLTYFAVMHQLPSAGVFNMNSIGFLGFWSLLCLHFILEECNFSFFKDEVSS